MTIVLLDSALSIENEGVSGFMIVHSSLSNGEATKSDS